MRDHVARIFRDRFGGTPDLVVRSPGRVNLIGDHTDYNDGFVLPMAIDQATWLAARSRNDRRISLQSEKLGSAELSLDEHAPTGTWSDYVQGVLWSLELPLDRGFDAVIATSVPVGAGLSSSASLELAVARLTVELAGGGWDPVAAALACQHAENEFVGMPCGIMDQLIVASGIAGAALLIDCRTLETNPAPLPHEVTAVILDTGTRRRLVDSEYQSRRAACDRVAAAVGAPALRDVSLDQLDAVRLDENDRRRARHVVTENDRTVRAAAAMASGDVAGMGRLMNESHASLRNDYETSSPALDAIVEIARGHPACVGARVTGAGFAGCAVALVRSERVGDFTTAVGPGYDAATGNTSALYPTSAAAGVCLA